MILLTRLSGSVFALNSELIERIDTTPDTVITLVDGKKYVVAEPLRQVVDAVCYYRGQTIALGSHLCCELESEQEYRPTLASVAPLPGAESRQGER